MPEEVVQISLQRPEIAEQIVYFTAKALINLPVEGNMMDDIADPICQLLHRASYCMDNFIVEPRTEHKVHVSIAYSDYGMSQTFKLNFSVTDQGNVIWEE